MGFSPEKSNKKCNEVLLVVDKLEENRSLFLHEKIQGYSKETHF
jgi:hypothetical protein